MVVVVIFAKKQYDIYDEVDEVLELQLLNDFALADEIIIDIWICEVLEKDEQQILLEDDDELEVGDIIINLFDEFEYLVIYLELIKNIDLDDEFELDTTEIVIDDEDGEVAEVVVELDVKV